MVSTTANNSEGNKKKFKWEILIHMNYECKKDTAFLNINNKLAGK